MFKNSMILAVAVAAMFAACKKEATATTTSQKIMNKWSIVTAVQVTYSNGSAVNSSTYTGISTDYADFRADGKVYESVSGQYDTSTYKIFSDTLMLINSDTVQIKTITDNSFIASDKSILSTSAYATTLLTLKK